MFRSLKRTGVGLDLDVCEARVVELAGKAGAPELFAFGRIPMPEGAVSKGAILEPQRVGEALSALWSENGISSQEVILGISSQDILVRFADFPKVPPEKLGNLIRLQAQEFLPMPLNEVVFDYMVLGDEKQEDREYQEVLLVAARRSMVEGFLSAMEAAGLVPQDFDISSLALLRMLSPEDKLKTVAMLYVPYEVASIVIADRGVPRLARFVPVSLKEIIGDECFRKTNKSSEPFIIDWNEKDFYRWSDILASEIGSSVEYYQSQRGSREVEKITLSGCAVRVEGLVERLQESFDIPVEVLNPYEGIKMEQQAEYLLSGRSSDFTLNTSLALRGLEG